MVKEELDAGGPSMPLFFPLLLLFFFSTALPPPSCTAQGNLTSDALALLAFKNSLILGPNSRLGSWNSSSISTICSTWAFVTCSSSNQSRVSELRLPGRSLYGAIMPDTIGRLDALNTLSLRSNRLSGHLPPDLMNLSALQTLILQKNGFSGSLPGADFSAWPLLLQLDVSFNGFSGSIPDSLKSLKHLKSLCLQNNLFTGAIPSLDIPSLQTFNVSDNNLNGSIPDSLARFNSSSFTGNDNLCGFPLQACDNASSSEALHSKSDRKLSNSQIIGIAFGSAGMVGLLGLVLVLCIFLWRRRGRRSEEVGTMRGGMGEAGVEEQTDQAVKRELPSTAGVIISAMEAGSEVKKKLVFIDGKQQFDLDDLLRASAEVLGKGAMGTSYRAVLEDGRIVAVKRLRDVDDSRLDEHREGISAIGRLQHDNLVPLRAYYLEKEENLLVYDFMQNGSLYALLHGSHDTLGWDERVRIAATAAKGLAFLHACGMVHGNLKSTNVLLKSNLEACLTDYGIARILSFTPAAAQLPLGYAAPEVTHPRSLSPKSDVFSFGVLLLELLTGKVPSSFAPSSSLRPVASSPSRSFDAVDLPRLVGSIGPEERTARVFDPSLIHSGQPFNEEEMVHLLQVAMPCVEPSPDRRPSMDNVVQMIDSIRRTTDDDKSSDS